MRHLASLALRHFVFRLAARACLVATVLAGSACDRPACPGAHAPTLDPLAPRLVAVNVLSQDSTDPWALVLEVLFEAPHGDASQGTLDVYVGAGTPISVALFPYFGPSNVDLDAISGRLAVPVHLSSDTVQDDTLLRLGLQMQDGSESFSNCSTLELHVYVEIVDNRSLVSPARYAAATVLAPSLRGRR